MAWSAAKGPNSKQNGMEPTSYAEEFEVCRRSYSFREMGSKQMQQYFLLPAEVCLIAMTIGEKDPFNTAFTMQACFCHVVCPFFYKGKLGIIRILQTAVFIQIVILYCNKRLDIDV